MHVRSVLLTLYAPGAQSLKDKRQILRSLLDRIENKFNVSIAEVDAQDLYQRLVIGIACVSSSENMARRQIDAVVRFIEDVAPVELISIEDY